MDTSSSKTFKTSVGNATKANKGPKLEFTAVGTKISYFCDAAPEFFMRVTTKAALCQGGICLVPTEARPGSSNP